MVTLYQVNLHIIFLGGVTVFKLYKIFGNLLDCAETFPDPSPLILNSVRILPCKAADLGKKLFATIVTHQRAFRSARIQVTQCSQGPRV